jgi:hypothetical protein
MSPNTISFVRPVYSGPARDNSRCVGIGIGGEPTAHAFESVPSLAIAFGYMPASRTAPAGVSRIHELDRDAVETALVSDFGLQVRKRPGVQDAPLSLGSPYPTTDALEVFKGYPAAGAFGLDANLFRNDVVLMMYEAGFTPSEPLQNPLGRTSAFGLKALPLPPTSFPDAGDLFGLTVRSALRISSDIDEAQVHPQPILTRRGFRLGEADSDKQVKRTIPENQIRFASVVREHLELPRPTDKRNAQSTAQTPNACDRLSQVPRKQSGVIRERAQRAKLPLYRSVQFIGVNDLSVGSNNHLRREFRKGSPASVVNQSMQGNLRKCLGSPSPLRNPVTGSIFRNQRLFEDRGLRSVSQQLHLDRKGHDAVSFHYSEMSITPLLRINFYEHCRNPQPNPQRGI